MLPAETDRVWNFLEEQPALAGFVLVGGTALALRIHHRRSDDLDLAWTEPRLPKERLAALCRTAALQSFDFQRHDDVVTVQAFADAGLSLEDYQQNFLVDGRVRVSFFAPEPPLARVLKSPPEPRVRIATLSELFKAKCLVSAIRSKTRDWLDLYLLLRNHGFTMRDYRAAFLEADLASQCETGLNRLCSGMPQKDDEGYAHLMQTPPTLAEMTAFFKARRDELEIALAADAAKARRPSGLDGSSG